MNDAIKISVLIANYNGVEIISPCIDSILIQQCDAEIEIIVHDDASTDNSVVLIKQKYPNIQLIESTENLGYCKSNNRLAENACGQYFLFLNNDAMLRDGALQALLRYSVEHHHHGILSLPQYDAETGELLDKGMDMDIFANPVPNVKEGVSSVATVMGACLWIKSSLWEDIGGFPEWFGSIAEDMYLCCYCRLLGNEVIAMDVSGYDHWVGHSFGGGKVKRQALSTSYKRRSLSELNKTRVMILFYPTLLLFFSLPLHLLLLCLEGLILSLVKLSFRPVMEIYLPCILKTISEAVTLYKKRRYIQARRLVSAKTFRKPIKFILQKIHLFKHYGIPEIR